MSILRINARLDSATLKTLRDSILEEPEVESITLSSSTPAARSLLDRSPQRQTELLDIVLDLAVSLASSAIYDSLVSRLRKRAEALRVNIAVDAATPSPTFPVPLKTSGAKKKRKVKKPGK